MRNINTKAKRQSRWIPACAGMTGKTAFAVGTGPCACPAGDNHGGRTTQKGCPYKGVRTGRDLSLRFQYDCRYSVVLDIYICPRGYPFFGRQVRTGTGACPYESAPPAHRSAIPRSSLGIYPSLAPGLSLAIESARSRREGDHENFMEECNACPRAEVKRTAASCPWLLVLLLLVLFAAPGWAAMRRTATGPVSVDAMATDLDTPWGLAFLPGGAFLVTERDGALYHFDSARRKTKVSGAPKVYAWGQGGLMDVAAARDFPEKPARFFSLFRNPTFAAEARRSPSPRFQPTTEAREPARHFRDGVPLPRRAAFRLAGRGGAGRDAISHARREGRPRYGAGPFSPPRQDNPHPARRERSPGQSPYWVGGGAA